MLMRNAIACCTSLNQSIDQSIKQLVVYYFASVGVRNIEMSVSVCRYVCLSAGISQKQHTRTLPNFLCLQPMAVAWPCSDGNLIGYDVQTVQTCTQQYSLSVVCRVHFVLK